MGAQTLKKKQEFNYRRGSSAFYCSHCNHFVSQFLVQDVDGAAKSIEPRCRMIGLENGRGYRVHPKDICDKYDQSALEARLRGFSRI